MPSATIILAFRIAVTRCRVALDPYQLVLPPFNGHELRPVLAFTCKGEITGYRVAVGRDARRGDRTRLVELETVSGDGEKPLCPSSKCSHLGPTPNAPAAKPVSE